MRPACSVLRRHRDPLRPKAERQGEEGAGDAAAGEEELPELTSDETIITLVNDDDLQPVFSLSAEEIAALPRVEVELWADAAPRTAENFRCLCTGDKGAARAFGSPPLHFAKTKVHRIVPGQILQAATSHAATGGAASRSTAQSSPTSRSSRSTAAPASSRWPTRGPTPTDRSST